MTRLFIKGLHCPYTGIKFKILTTKRMPLIFSTCKLMVQLYWNLVNLTIVKCQRLYVKNVFHGHFPIVDCSMVIFL